LTSYLLEVFFKVKYFLLIYQMEALSSSLFVSLFVRDEFSPMFNNRAWAFYELARRWALPVISLDCLHDENLLWRRANLSCHAVHVCVCVQCSVWTRSCVQCSSIIRVYEFYFTGVYNGRKLDASLLKDKLKHIPSFVL